MGYKILYKGEIYSEQYQTRNHWVRYNQNQYQVVPIIDLSPYSTKAALTFYTGTTAPATYTSKLLFNGYTGATLTALNSKLNTTTFASHTGSTKLRAGSNITLTPSSTGITVSSTASSSGTITGATNGLSLSSNGKKIKLGGTLTGNTTVEIGTSSQLDLKATATVNAFAQHFS